MPNPIGASSRWLLEAVDERRLRRADGSRDHPSDVPPRRPSARDGRDEPVDDALGPAEVVAPTQVAVTTVGYDIRSGQRVLAEVGS